MQVIVVDCKGFKVNGYFILVIEIFDDFGVFYILEYLVFMGFKSYKYKGLFDKLVGRVYFNINVWIVVDYIVYIFEIVGWDGFVQIFFVYFEYVIFFNIMDDVCVIEVYYIDGEGNDVGVVYFEM